MCGRYSLANTNQLSLRVDISDPVHVPVDPNVALSTEDVLDEDVTGLRVVAPLLVALVRRGYEGERS